MYLLSVLFIFILFIFTVVVSGGSLVYLANFLDITSLILILLIDIPMLLLTRLWKDFCRAFSIAVNPNSDPSILQLKNSINAISLIIKTSLTASGFITMIGIINLLRQLDDLASLGPALMVICLTFFYSLLFILILLPLRTLLTKRLDEKISAE